MTCPMATGASAVTVFRARTQSKILFLGMSPAVLTLTAGSTPPRTGTVVVTMRVGAVTSLRA